MSKESFILSNDSISKILNFIRNWILIAAPEKSFGPWKETWLTRLTCISVLLITMIILVGCKVGLYFSVIYYWVLIFLWWFTDEKGDPIIHTILLTILYEDRQLKPTSNNTGLLIISLIPYIIGVLIISKFILNKIIYKNEKFIPLM